LISFYVALDRINLTVNVVTDVDSGASIKQGACDIADLIEQACRTSLPLLSELPPDDGDGELRAKIKAMKRFTSA
jgi:hypothetical protein